MGGEREQEREDAEQRLGIGVEALNQLGGKVELYILSIVTASDTVSSQMGTPFSPLFNEPVSMRVSLPPWPSMTTTGLAVTRLLSSSSNLSPWLSQLNA